MFKSGLKELVRLAYIAGAAEQYNMIENTSHITSSKRADELLQEFEEGGEVMRNKFEIMYPSDHEEAGEQYKPPAHCMVVMNNQGIFFLYHGEEYYPWIQHLSQVLPTYDVVWK